MIERKEPMIISNTYCTWDSINQCIVVNGVNFQGVIPTEELGIPRINSGPIISNVTPNNVPTPLDVLILLENPFKVFVLRQENNKYIFSHKAYLEACKASLVVGEVYDAVIYSYCHWGAFCKIGDAPVLIYITDWSICRFYNMQNVARIGNVEKVKIISKVVDKNGIRITASRKAAAPIVKFNQGDTVVATLGSLTDTNDGFFCEISPNTNAIVDVPPEKINFLREGMRVVAYIRKISPRGYKLQYLQSLI